MRKLLATAAVLAAMTTGAMATQDELPPTPRQWAIAHCNDSFMPKNNAGVPEVFLIEQSGADISESDRVVVGQRTASAFDGNRYLFPQEGREFAFIFRFAKSDESYPPATFQPYRERATRCDALTVPQSE